MRRRLLALEMKKALGDRRFWLFLVLLIGLQCFFLYRAESKKGYSMEAYRAVYAQLEEWEPEEAAAYAKVRREVLSYARWGMWEEMEQVMEEKANPSWPDTLYTGSESRDALLFDRVAAEVGSVLGRDSQLAEVVAAADRLQGIGIFQMGEDSYTRRNREKTKADFLEAQSVPVTGFFPEQGIRMVMENGIGDAFVLLMVLLSVYLIVFQGYENGLEPVLSCTKKGRGSVLVWRTAAVAGCVGIAWAGLFLSALLCGAVWYGLGDLSRPVQLISDYVTCLSSLSAGGLLGLTFFLKWLVFILLGLFLIFLVKAGAGILLPSAGILAWFGLGYFCWRGIADSSAWRWLRYVNLYYLLRPDMALGVYRNLNFFQIPVSCRTFSWAAFVLLGAAGSAGLFAVRRNGVKMISVRKRSRGSWGRAPARSRIRGLLGTEFRKVWLQRHMLILMAAVLAFQVWTYHGKTIFMDLVERIYAGYLTEWERELDGTDEELTGIVEREEQEVLRQMTEVSGSNVAELRMTAFSMAKQRFEALQETARSREEKPYLFYEGIYGLLVDDPEQDAMTGALAFLLVLAAVTHMTGHEYQSGMRDMIRTTRQGKKRYLRDKMAVLASLCVGIWLAVYVPDLWLTAKTWSLDTLGVPVYSLPVFANFPLAISIGTYLVILYVWRLLLLFALGTGMLLLMDVFRNEMVGFLVMGVVFGLPYLLYYISGAAYGDWGLLRWLGFNAMMVG